VQKATAKKEKEKQDGEFAAFLKCALKVHSDAAARLGLEFLDDHRQCVEFFFCQAKHQRGLEWLQTWLSGQAVPFFAEVDESRFERSIKDCQENQEKERQKQVQTLLAEQWSTMDGNARGPFLAPVQKNLDAMLKLYVQLFADTATRLEVAFSEDDRACVEIVFRMLIEQRGLKQIDTWLNDGSEKQFAEPGGGGSSGAFGSSGGFGAMSFGGGGGGGSYEVSGQI